MVRSKKLNRKNRFYERVSLERQVLELVNGAGFDLAPLPGLTAQSIDTWARGANVEKDPRIAEIARLLKEIAVRCQIDADCSRDVFSEEEQLVSKSTTESFVHRLREKFGGIETPRKGR